MGTSQSKRNKISKFRTSSVGTVGELDEQDEDRILNNTGKLSSMKGTWFHSLAQVFCMNIIKTYLTYSYLPICIFQQTIILGIPPRLAKRTIPMQTMAITFYRQISKCYIWFFTFSLSFFDGLRTIDWCISYSIFNNIHRQYLRLIECKEISLEYKKRKNVLQKFLVCWARWKVYLQHFFRCPFYCPFYSLCY